MHALLLLSLLLTGTASQAPVLPPGKYVYSDFCVGAKPWDLYGHRVVLSHGREGDWVRIDFPGEGEDGPLFATAVILDAKTGKLFFSYQSTEDEYAFEGVATPKGLTGLFDDDNATHSLPRIPNSWPDDLPCKAVHPAR